MSTGLVAKDDSGLIPASVLPAGVDTDANGNIVLGLGQLADNATDGFPYISTTTSGAPSGTPTAKAGYVPLVYDDTNDKLYAYNSGWQDLTAGGGGGGGDVTKVGTPVNDQVGVWTGDGTLEGTSALTFSATGVLSITGTVTCPNGGNSEQFGATAVADGANCVAVGASSNANVTDAVAVGYDASANNTNATCVGSQGQSNAENATGVGYAVSASTSAAALGSGAAAGTDCVALGKDSTATSGGSIAIGESASANHANGIAIGENSVAGNGITIGTAISSTGAGTIAIGHAITTTTNTNGVLIGDSAILLGNGGVGLGQSAVARSESVAIGRSANAGSNAVAIGTNAQTSATATYGVALGPYANCGHARTLCFGANSTSQASYHINFGANNSNDYFDFMWLGKGVVAAAPRSSFQISPSQASGLDLAGTDLKITGGASTGTGVGGDIIFQTTTASGSSSSTLNTPVTALTIDQTQVCTFTNPMKRSTEAGITASTTQSQGEQPLTKEVNEISVCANEGDACTMPPAEAGLILFVINNGANGVDLYPASGDQFEGYALNAAINITSGDQFFFISYDGTNWIVFDQG